MQRRLWLILLLIVFGWHTPCHDTSMIGSSSTNATIINDQRSLQFDGMFIGDNYEFYNQNPRGKGKKGQRVVNPARVRASNLKKAVIDILAGIFA